MKKTLRILVITLVLALALAVTASAASFASFADDLKEIGMFRGTGAGYELDREATRLEAAIMLVRLLGEEENAAAAYEEGTIDHPFTDVPEQSAFYVAYLYTNKLSDGVSATEFGSSNVCSAQMYCTYLLRVLGYSDKDGGDFTYAGVLDFAKQKGLADSTLLSTTFTRDSLVAVTYQALATDVKGGDGRLLSQLIESGAVDEDKADHISQKIALYDKINSASAALNSGNSLEADVTMDMSMTVGGTTVTLNDMAVQMKMNITGTSIEAEIIITTVDPTTKEPITVTEWMKDGWLYIDDGTQKNKVKMDYGDMLATIQDSTVSYTPSPIYYFNELTEATVNGETEYTMSISPEFLTSAAGAALEQALGDAQSLNIEIRDFTQSFKLDQNGILKSIGMLIDMSMTDPTLGNIDAAISYDMTLKSIGKTVTINFPDFSAYEEISDITTE